MLQWKYFRNVKQRSKESNSFSAACARFENSREIISLTTTIHKTSAVVFSWDLFSENI